MGRPGRPQLPLNPDDGAVARFAGQLRAVHEAMPGTVTLTELSKQANYSTAAFSNACGGKTLPTWDVTAAFLQACGHEADAKWWTDWVAARKEAGRAGERMPRLPPKPPFPIAEHDSAEALISAAAGPKQAWRHVGAWTKKGLDLMSVIVVAAAVTVVVIWVSGEDDQAAPSCEEIGVAHESVDAFRVNRAAWQRAYDAAGGRQALGCPLSRRDQGLVHAWGPGLSQDLVGDQQRQTRLMALDTDKVFVMTGTLWIDYTRPQNNLAAGLQGYPVSEPTKCGHATVILLDKGEYTPGAMVSTPTERYVWLPRPVWQLYRELGGPTGPLGRPRNGLNADIEGSIEFENGTTIELPSGRVSVPDEAVVDAASSAPPCPP